MIKLVIGDKNLSSWSLRPWLVLRQSQIEFGEIQIGLDRPDTRSSILRYSPSAKVPALVDNDLTVYESIAVCEYLADKFPNAHLWPEDIGARAVARSISAEMHAGFASLRTECPMRCAEHLPGKKLSAATQADVSRIVSIWKDCRQRYGGAGSMLFGSFTIADAMYAPVVTRFKTYEIAVNDPIAQIYMDTIWALPPMREWVEKAKLEVNAH